MKRGVMCGVMLACVVGFGCERDGEGGDGSTELVEPVLEKSKADKLDAVKVVADMQIDGEFAGEFTEDLQFFGHIFYTGKTGSVIDLEVTQKGSSRGLDTTLFLYGEKEPGDWQKLMVDDNDGWGDLSKLTDVDFRGNFRRYMAVVGTADGQGRGSYNLAITCTSGDCKARDAVPAECPETTLGWIDECMAELVFDSQGSITDAAQSCVELDASADYFDVDCNVGAFGTPQTWCAQGFTAFNDILYPACRAEVIGELGGTLVLDRKDPSQGIVEDVFQNACNFCENTVELYGFDASIASMQDVIFAVQGLEDNDSFRWSVRQSVDFETWVADGLQQPVLDEFEAVSPDELSVAALETEWAPAAGAEEFIVVDIIVHWESGQVLLIRSVSGD